MFKKDGIIYNIGEHIIIRANQIAQKRIKYDKKTKKHIVQSEKFENYGQIDKINIFLEYLGNGNFRESISGVIMTIEPNDDRIAPYKAVLRGYEEKYAKANKAPLDKALEYPLTIVGSWNLIDLKKIKEISEANSPKILSQINKYDKEILRSSVYSTEIQELLKEYIKILEEEAHKKIKEDFAYMVSTAQETAEKENADLENMVNLASQFLNQIESNSKRK